MARCDCRWHCAHYVALAAVQWRSPYPDNGKLERLGGPARPAAPELKPLVDTLDRNVERLNGLFFTFRDYAVIARRP